MPVYANGDPLKGEETLSFSKITIINVLGSPSKIWLAFGFVILNSIAAYLVVYRFWKET